jgi:hypothetical protein
MVKRKITREPTFEAQINKITGPLVTFIQHDDLVRMLQQLEAEKDNITDKFDMCDLERVIHGLASLSRRAAMWCERLTPTNDEWKYRVRRVHDNGQIEAER